MPALSPTRCGLAGPINFMDLLRPALAIGRPAVLHDVCNRAAAQRPLPASPLCDELVRWGASVSSRQVLLAAARAWPPLADIHCAGHCWLALEALRRGDLAGALRQLPWAALLPPALLAWARDQLEALLPATLDRSLQHEPMVLLLALGALAYQLHAEAEQNTPSTTRSVPAHLLRGARVLLDARRALQELHPAPHAFVGGMLAGPAPERPMVHPTDLATRSLAGPAGVGQQLAAFHSASGLLACWPLPGAAGVPRNSRGGARPHAPAGQPGPSGVAKSSSRPAPRRSTTIARAGSRSGQSAAGVGDDERPLTPFHGHPASGVAGYDDGNREVLWSPLHPDPPLGGKPKVRTGEEEAGPLVKARAGTAVRPVPVPGPGVFPHRAPQNVTRLDTGLLPSAHGDARVDLDCLAVDDDRVALLLVRRKRYQPTLMRFCIPSEETPWFKALLSAPEATTRGMGRWMVSELVHERVPHALRPLQVRRYGGEEDILRNRAPVARALADDRVFALLTMSLLDAPLRREAGRWDLQYLQRNTFCLMQHTGVDRVERLYMAYFLHRESSNCSGVRGGFLAVDVNADGQFSVTDETHASAIVGDSLYALTTSVEKFTGLRCVTSSEHTPPDRLAPPAANLFVQDDQTLSLRTPGTHLPLDPALDLFSPVTVWMDGYSRPLSMYLGSYVLVNDAIVFADAEGRSGTLHFEDNEAGTPLRSLRCDHLQDCTFAALHGLQSGRRYTTDEVMETLERNGLVWLPGLPGMQTETWWCRTAADSGTPLPAAAARVAAPARSMPTSTFLFENGTLHYADHDGQAGALMFRPSAGHATPRFTLIDTGTDHAARLLARLRLQRNQAYTEAEITWALQRDGFMSND